MYTLYYSPGSCSLVIHCLLEELGAPFETRLGTWERAKTLEQVVTLATEVHPLFNRFFHQDDFSEAKDVQAAVKARGTEKLAAYFRGEDAALAERPAVARAMAREGIKAFG